MILKGKLICLLLLSLNKVQRALTQSLPNEDVVFPATAKNDDLSVRPSNKDHAVVMGNMTMADEKRRLMKTSEIRFSKFEGGSKYQPMTDSLYPVYGEVYNYLKGETDAVDVFMVNEPGIREYHVPILIEKLGGLPFYPEEDENAEFWDYLREVIDVREIRRKKPHKRLFPRADIWKSRDLNECAMAVHNEEPGTIQQELVDDLLDERWGRVYFDGRMFPHTYDKTVPLRYFQKQMRRANLWTFDTVMPPTFAAKWYAGRPRPEEVIWAIKTGTISEGVPEDIKKYCTNLDIKDATEFTAYPEGSPKHPSWPAMHAASGSCSIWMAVMLDLNKEQLCQARLTDYAIAYSRTIAGVHYTDDNIFGLNFAQEVIGRALPQYMKKHYGADPKLVARKVRQYKFDWNNFDPSNPCQF